LRLQPGRAFTLIGGLGRLMFTEVRPEAALYKPFNLWINAGFPRSGAMQSNPDHSMLFSEDVSQRGVEAGGLWSRPDLAAVVYSRGKYRPEWTAHLYSFELKTHSGLNVSAVYEAFAHTRYVNFSYLCWQTPDPENAQSKSIIDLCSEYGVGAITCFDPAKLSSFKVHLKANHSVTTTTDFDSFVSRRFRPETQIRISDWLASNGWRFPSENEGQL